MKCSLICATSIFALAAACPAHAFVVTAAPGETSLYDLVHDGESAAATPESLAIAAMALRATANDRQDAGFTGPLDRFAAAGTAFPLVPLGAATGTPPDNDFATQFAGTWRWNAWQKALATGMARIAPLIGTIDDGSAGNEKPGSTVFVAQSNPDSRRRSTAANAFAASSTNTATITVTGPAALRQRAGSGFAVAAPNDVQPLSQASDPAPTTPVPPMPSYHYSPQPGPAAKANLVAAGFSQAITASGAPNLVYKPIVAANRGTDTASARPISPAAIYARLLDVTLPIDGQADATSADGTRRFLPASVSANPTAMAARYVTSVLDAAPANPSGQTVEAFQIGQSGRAKTVDGATASVADPLRGKIMAGAGALDNSLALP